MKTIFVYIAIAASWLGLITACNSIDPEERFIDVTPAKVKRAVLLEDFTAQRCIYCPAATEEIHRLQEAYGEENVIAVAIHGTALAIPESNTTVTGLMNEESDLLRKERDEDMALPSVYVNRYGKASSIAELGAIVKEALEQETGIALNLHVTWNLLRDEMRIETKINADEDIDAKLQLWILEDSIEAIQLFPKGKVEANYLHRNVFRKAVNGRTGEMLSLSKGEQKVMSHTLKPAPKWNKSNLKVVAFVSDDNRLLQVMSKHIR